MQTIQKMMEEDWSGFLDLARQEGWRVPESELALLRGPLAGSAFVLKHNGDSCGYVSAVAAGDCGWIGNLIVPEQKRGRGYGKRLFSHALKRLTAQGCRSLWLTASPQGRPLYEKHGFVAIDTVERWVYPASAPRPAGGGEASPSTCLLSADASAWGVARTALLLPLLAGGELAASGLTAALLQPGDKLQVLGPWYSSSSCPRENRTVLTRLLAAAGPAEVCADVPGTSPVRPLFAAAGFHHAGTTDLMVRGDRAGLNLASLVSLASLGSIG